MWVTLDQRVGKKLNQRNHFCYLFIFDKKPVITSYSIHYTKLYETESPYYAQAFARNLHAAYMEYTNTFPNDSGKGQALAKDFEDGLVFLQYGPATLNLIQEYAHLLTFYLSNTDEALTVLEKGLQIPGLKAEQIGVLKAEMADTRNNFV